MHSDTSITYPRLVRRVRAAMLDSIAMYLAMMAGVWALSAWQVELLWLKLLLIPGPFLLYEPLMVSLLGGTLGHHWQGIRVRSVGNVRHLPFYRALIRYLLKTLLGGFSWLWVLLSRRHQALHDLCTAALVYNTPNPSLPRYEALRDRFGARAGYRYPAAWRRLLIGVTYALVAAIPILVVGFYILPSECLENIRCSKGQEAILALLELIWWLALLPSVVLGWQGRLWGARRVRIQSETVS